MVTTSASSSCTRSLKNFPVNVDNEVTDNHDRHVAFRTSKYPRMHSKIGPYVEMDSNIGKATEHRLLNLINATSSSGKDYYVIYGAEQESYSQNHYYLSIRSACVHRHPLRTREPVIIVAVIIKILSIEISFVGRSKDHFFEWKANEKEDDYRVKYHNYTLHMFHCDQQQHSDVHMSIGPDTDAELLPATSKVFFAAAAVYPM